MTIYFYRTSDKYGCFSNFSRHGFKFEGDYWKTSEHYFQAKKFSKTKYEAEIRLAKTPMDAAKMGRDRTKPLRKDWEEVKDDIMRRAVLEKFKSHKDIQQILLSTGMEEIVENTFNVLLLGMW